MTNRRKELTNKYKERTVIGGVYTITNTASGKYLLSHAVNLQSVRNHFQFAATTGSTLHPKLQKDWQELGAQAFKLVILEELEQKPEQSATAFREDLQTLEQLWREKLDPALAY
jgi:hypothetical protein